MLELNRNKATVQTVVTAIDSTSVVKNLSAFCIEFRLYNKAEDTIYARVWNTLLGHWDEIIEAQLNEKERKKWRSSYKSILEGE